MPIPPPERDITYTNEFHDEIALSVGTDSVAFYGTTSCFPVQLEPPH